MRTPAVEATSAASSGSGSAVFSPSESRIDRGGAEVPEVGALRSTVRRCGRVAGSICTVRPAIAVERGLDARARATVPPCGVEPVDRGEDGGPVGRRLLGDQAPLR